VKTEHTAKDDSIFLIVILLAVIVFLSLLLCIIIYCCFCRRRDNHKVSKAELGSIEDMYLGSRSKSPLFDELSIPFIDCSLPPTPKTGRSQNALDILLGRSLGSATSLSDRAS
jgi:hypothetical protein